MRMLRKEVKQWLKGQQSLGKSVQKSGVKRAKYNRIRKTALKGIEDLSFLIANLPEKQLNQIFSADRKEVRAFFEELFSLKIDAKSHEEWLKMKESKETKAKRDRLVKLAGLVLATIGNIEFARAVLPQQLVPYLRSYPYTENFGFIITQAKSQLVKS